jgi:23S rRNA pseudouridine2457 synthase
MLNQNKYYILYKPYGYLCQFTQETEKHLCLADLNMEIPKNVFPVGRLDKDSEGLIILSNDGRLNHRLLDPKYQHRRTYLVQVEGDITSDAIHQLEMGIEIKLKKRTYKTLPSKAKKIDTPDYIPTRNPPIRFRREIPTSWLELELKEGKNRQVRKMCAGTGFPVLRLIRKSIEALDGIDLAPGQYQEMSLQNLEEKLGFKL